MILFPKGILVTNQEYQCLLHLETNPNLWLANTIKEKAKARQEALINEWLPRLFADPTVDKVPTDANSLVRLILKRADFQFRASVPGLRSSFNTERYNAQDRLPGTILIPHGIKLTDTQAKCILAYVYDLEDWVYGALLGHINRGKKKMIAQYWSMPENPYLPADEGAFLEEIAKHKTYRSLPDQMKAGGKE